MPSSRKPDLAAALSQLRERFLASIAGRIELFADLARTLEGDDSAVASLESLRGELHRFHGTAGSYGFLAAGRVAASLELVVGHWLSDPSLHGGRRAAMVERFVAILHAEFGEPNHPRPSRLLLVDLPDDQAVGIGAEAFAAGLAPERIGLLQLSTQLESDARAAVIAFVPSAELPPLGSRPFVQCMPDIDPAAVIRAVCGSPP